MLSVYLTLLNVKVNKKNIEQDVAKCVGEREGMREPKAIHDRRADQLQAAGSGPVNFHASSESEFDAWVRVNTRVDEKLHFLRQIYN